MVHTRYNEGLLLYGRDVFNVGLARTVRWQLYLYTRPPPRIMFKDMTSVVVELPLDTCCAVRRECLVHVGDKDACNMLCGSNTLREKVIVEHQSVEEEPRVENSWCDNWKLLCVYNVNKKCKGNFILAWINNTHLAPAVDQTRSGGKERIKAVCEHRDTAGATKKQSHGAWAARVIVGYHSSTSC